MVDAARRGRHVPDPLHGLEGAQRPAPGASPATAAGACREYGFARIGDDGEPLTGDRRRAPDVRDRGGGLRVPRPAVHRARAARGPRRDRGRARPGRLPRSSRAPTCAATATPTPSGSDGIHPIEAMAEARPPPRLRVPGPDRPHPVARHRPRPRRPSGSSSSAAIIAELNARFARGGGAPGPRRRRRRPRASGCSTAASSRSAPTASSTIDDELLARFDVVVASLHVARRQPRAELTRRTLNAIRSPHVDIIAHPSGRMIQTRDDLDLDWEAVYAEAAPRPARRSR